MKAAYAGAQTTRVGDMGRVTGFLIKSTGHLCLSPICTWKI